MEDHVPEATPQKVRRVLLLLGRAPRRIAAITRGLGNSRLRRRPQADSWSAAEILAHLRACADVWGKCIATIISVDHPQLRHVSPRSWIRKTDYLTQDVPGSLRAYSAQRSVLLRSLRALEPRGWSRGATLKGTTRPRQETVFSYALRLAKHEAKHIGQMERALGRDGEPRPTRARGMSGAPRSKAKRPAKESTL